MPPVHEAPVQLAPVHDAPFTATSPVTAVPLRTRCSAPRAVSRLPVPSDGAHVWVDAETAGTAAAAAATLTTPLPVISGLPPLMGVVEETSTLLTWSGVRAG